MPHSSTPPTTSPGRSSTEKEEALERLKKKRAEAPMAFSRPFANVDFSSVNSTVSDLASLQELFEYLRDERFLDWEKMPDFPRRIPWLYPWDGCSDRATYMRKLIERRKLTVPTRVFAFPPHDKSFTSTSPYYQKTGTWNYHTALITRVGDEIYVIDPALNFEGPLKVADWVAKLGIPSVEVFLAICSPLSSTAERKCHQTDPEEAYNRAFGVKDLFLRNEWEEVMNLKGSGSKDPLEVLGEHPPWRH